MKFGIFKNFNLSLSERFFLGLPDTIVRIDGQMEIEGNLGRYSKWKKNGENSSHGGVGELKMGRFSTLFLK